MSQRVESENAPELADSLLKIFGGSRKWLQLQAVNLRTGERRPWLSVEVTGAGEEMSEQWREAALDHLRGKRRLGVFPVGTAPATLHKVHFGVVDLDGTDRLPDALALLRTTEQEGLSGYLEASWTPGHYRVWFLWNRPLNAGMVRDRLSGLLVHLGIEAEVRPNTGEAREWSIRPGQRGIGLPFFGALLPGASNGNRCQMVDPCTLAPVSPGRFFLDLERNSAPPRRRPPAAKPRRCPSAGPRRNVDALLQAWPGCGEGEAMFLPSGTTVYGRNSALTSLAGALLCRGVPPGELERCLTEANGKNRPPLPAREIASIARSVGRYPAPSSVARADLVPSFCTSTAKGANNMTCNDLADES